MTLPPMVLRIHMPTTKGGTFRLWLPLFLVYPLLLALSIILAPLMLLLTLLLWPVGLGKTFLLLGPYIVRVICGLRGLTVDVQSNKQKILISFN
jgi:hypothetical protein